MNNLAYKKQDSGLYLPDRKIIQPSNDIGSPRGVMRGVNRGSKLREVLGVGGVVDPIDMPTIMWSMEAFRTETITHVGGLSSLIDDRTGNYDAAQTGVSSTRPITETRSYNGQNGLDFDGVAQYLILPPDFLNDIGDLNGSLYIIYQQDNVGIDGDTGLLKYGLSGTARYGMTINTFHTRIRGEWKTSFSTPDLNFTNDTTKPYVASMIRNGTDITIEQNFGALTTTEANAGNTATSKSCYIGAVNANDTPGSFFNGVIFAGYAFSSNLTIAEKLNLKLYTEGFFGEIF